MCVCVLKQRHSWAVSELLFNLCQMCVGVKWWSDSRDPPQPLRSWLMSDLTPHQHMCVCFFTKLNITDSDEDLIPINPLEKSSFEAKTHVLSCPDGTHWPARTVWVTWSKLRLASAEEVPADPGDVAADMNDSHASPAPAWCPTFHLRAIDGLTRVVSVGD